MESTLKAIKSRPEFLKTLVAFAFDQHSNLRRFSESFEPLGDGTTTGLYFVQVGPIVEDDITSFRDSYPTEVVFCSGLLAEMEDHEHRHHEEPFFICYPGGTERSLGTRAGEHGIDEIKGHGALRRMRLHLESRSSPAETEYWKVKIDDGSGEKGRVGLPEVQDCEYPFRNELENRRAAILTDSASSSFVPTFQNSRTCDDSYQWNSESKHLQQTRLWNVSQCSSRYRFSSFE